MIYVDAVELIAMLVVKAHNCGPDCLCWKLRPIPEIAKEIEKLQAAKDAHRGF